MKAAHLKTMKINYNYKQILAFLDYVEKVGIYTNDGQINNKGYYISKLKPGHSRVFYPTRMIDMIRRAEPTSILPHVDIENYITIKHNKINNYMWSINCIELNKFLLESKIKQFLKRK